MFEPENDLERVMRAAFEDPTMRPTFFRMLMDAQVFVVSIPEGSEFIDGQVVYADEAPMTLANFVQEGESFIPFFTAASRATAYFAEAFPKHAVASETARDLFERYPHVNFQLNPGTDRTLRLAPDEMARFLAGEFDELPKTTVRPLSDKVMLAHPKDRPEALIAALARELTPLDSVRGAWLMLAHYPGEAEHSWMLGLDVTDYGEDVHAALQRAFANAVLDRPLHQILVERGHSVSETLRTGIPIVHKKKRGFFNFSRS